MILGFITLGFILIGFASLSSELQVSTVLENKERSASAATACMEQAMDRLGRNASYAGNETLIVASSTCMVRPVTSGSGTWTLESWAQIEDQYTRYRVILTSRAPVAISSWNEIAEF
jgi:hypothetical protein